MTESFSERPITPLPFPRGPATAQVYEEDKEARGQTAYGAAAVTGSTAEGTAIELKQLALSAGQELKDQVALQQAKAAETLRSVRQELNDMAKQEQAVGLAGDLVRQTASGLDSLADWLENTNVGAALGQVRTFAERRPLAFMAIAVGTGFVVGRLASALEGREPSPAEGYEHDHALVTDAATPAGPTTVRDPEPWPDDHTSEEAESAAAKHYGP